MIVVLVMGIAAGLTAMGYYAGLNRGRAEVMRDWLEDLEQPDEEKADPRDEMLAEMMRRFMDLTLPATPAPRSEGDEGKEAVETPGEYEPPDDDWAGASDWTDKLLASHQDRPLVARLAPGQSPIPMGSEQLGGAASPMEEWRERGTAAFDAWAEQTAREDGEVLSKAWVDPIHLDGEVR